MCRICQTVEVSQNKVIHRESQSANNIFNQRSLEHDYRTLMTALRPGLRVLDIGCGTGAITKDIANRVGPTGHVVGIDNTASFVTEGQNLYSDIQNLELIHCDVLDFDSEEKFDLIVSARTFQWISTIGKAVDKIKMLLKPNGQISILDYNHEMIDWTPKIPKSMQNFYNMFLMWRKDAGMNNRIGFDIADILEEHGFDQIEVFNADEHYESSTPSHKAKIKIWSNVANSKQMVDEGYISDENRLEAIEDYNNWADNEAQSMTLKLREVRAVLNINR
ncbi:Methyltransferase domain-containing protein [Sphingobacterium nematocida]|uniref:Methyltransferase domain-containing protein n=1 Tax=Sphingobacterium nematocida TaxID=1513896 RepID=A0A1T5E6K7_9SPHI|nr:methyltransferase domain-containing protein [Sphingobacterium nematocida]SKB79722.1 Methyltransferase domain-containing protein [Sphingobacterium nematocida]